MGHSHYWATATTPWFGLLLLLAAISAVAVLIGFVHRKTRSLDGLTVGERKNLEYPERDILSMLRQKGGPLEQDEIIDSIPGDFDDLVKALYRLEVQKLISRKWNVERGAYTVEAQPGESG